MSLFAAAIIKILPVLAVVGQVVVVFLIILLLVGRKKWFPVFNFVADNSFLFAFIVALTATAGSLF